MVGVKMPSWIFCVKRVYGFSFHKLRLFQRKLLRPLQKIRLNSIQGFALWSSRFLLKIKRTITKVIVLFMVGVKRLELLTSSL